MEALPSSTPRSDIVTVTHPYFDNIEMVSLFQDYITEQAIRQRRNNYSRHESSLFCNPRRDGVAFNLLNIPVIFLFYGRRNRFMCVCNLLYWLVHFRGYGYRHVVAAVKCYCIRQLQFSGCEESVKLYSMRHVTVPVLVLQITKAEERRSWWNTH